MALTLSYSRTFFGTTPRSQIRRVAGAFNAAPKKKHMLRRNMQNVE
jgi:hypothetical protein